MLEIKTGTSGQFHATFNFSIINFMYQFRKIRNKRNFKFEHNPCILSEMDLRKRALSAADGGGPSVA